MRFNPFKTFKVYRPLEHTEKKFFSVICIAYLTSRDELQRAQRGLQVLGVALEVEKSISERGLQLRRALPRGRVGSDLVEGSHDVRTKMVSSLLLLREFVVKETAKKVVVVRSVGGED